MVFFHRKLYFSKDLESRGGQIFSGGGSNFFRGGGGWGVGGGVQMLISIETHITCDFSGGGPNPLPPSESAHTSTPKETYSFVFFQRVGPKPPVPNSGLAHDCMFGYLQVLHSSIGIMLKYFL